MRLICSLLLPSLLMIGGCSTLLSQGGDLTTQVDGWVAEHRYNRALDALRAVPPDHPGFNSLAPRIAEIESQRGDYIEQQLERAAEFEADGDWPGAIEVMDEALDHLPDAPELISQRQAYEQRRLHSIQLSQRAIAMEYGRYLLATRPSEEQLLQASPDGFFAQQRYRAYQQELNQVSRGLYAVGRQSLYENDSETAIEALTLSNQLAPNDLSEDLLFNIRQAQRDERQQQRQQQAAAAKQQLPQLQAQFEQSLRFNDLIGARRLLGEIQEIDADVSSTLQPQLQRRIDAQAAALLERGRLLYGQGLLQEALAVWREALQLKPDDPEILAAIERTETFLENLKNWGE
ncbi:hypothetical protein BGP77_03295 [Saccharospirillum sp. MSK14-1]|uniref:tetratricopeptide repeat protein n=1 Tax=Saccharospirillum sp. MSK14-1 TaxID=1897632 RepID=UPI000D3B93CB|nr:tetratricopeptide repeat protein [Saccharospirillum sp. MSK14-1]PTY36344.1 hypothetical protein BGP77_03295 [Saccharospirillum sp. MSK14-1]